MKKAYHSRSYFLVHHKYDYHCLPKSLTYVHTYVGFYEQNVMYVQEGKKQNVVVL
jgi:hypothetical protein